MRSVLR